MRRIFVAFLVAAACGGPSSPDPESSPAPEEPTGASLAAAGNGRGGGGGKCRDLDRDGAADLGCGGTDCNDRDPAIGPGAAEICGNGVDENCDGHVAECAPPGEDPPPGADPSCTTHACATWRGAGTCLGCHPEEAQQVLASQHYQWKGASPLNLNEPGTAQGKANGINSYCVAVQGPNFGQCNGCHVGRGAAPGTLAGADELLNIDCLVCHQDRYRRKKDASGAFVPDTAAMAISMDEAVRTVHRPTRTTCLACHAKAGGGDAYKRGDITLAHGTTADRAFDVHMATTGGDLACQACHRTSEHRIAGAGSDLRASDSGTHIGCADCHADRAATAHASDVVDRHVRRVACQTCHVPRYARNASDTAASEATEVHRTWLESVLVGGVYHPATVLAGDLLPRYAFWNGKQRTMLLGDTATRDAVTGHYATSRPDGAISDPASKLFPFKYKTAEQPFVASASMLTPMDMAKYRAGASAMDAARTGAASMGLGPVDVTFVTTDTMQLITHEVAPREQALGATCTACHGAQATQMNLPSLGYVIRGAPETICTQCHGFEVWDDAPAWLKIHDKHVTDKRYDCSFCHAFSRPERGLRLTR